MENNRQIRLSIDLSKDQHTTLKRCAVNAGVSMKDLIIDYLEYLKEVSEENIADTLLKRGMEDAGD